MQTGMDIVHGLDVVQGLMQVREDVPVPVMVGGYVNECSRAYKDHPIYDECLKRLALVMARWQTELLHRDYTASKYSFFMGGVVGLRVVECAADSELLSSLHSYLPLGESAPQLSVDEQFARQKVALWKLCKLGAERVNQVDMPFADWAPQLGVAEANIPSFTDGVQTMVAIGMQASEVRATQYIQTVLAEHEKQW